KYTYAQVDELSNRFANSLAALGVKPGETVVSMLDNNVDAVIAWLAINKVCAVSVPVNTALRGEFLRHQIDDAGAAIIICEADYLPRISAVADRLSKARLILYRGKPAETGSGPVAIAALDDHRGSDVSAPRAQPQPGDLAALIYTSGTTGPSKGCMVGHNYMVHLARQQGRAAPTGRDDVLWTPLPLFHMNALCTGIISTMLVGGTIAFSPRFSVSGFWPEIERC